MQNLSPRIAGVRKFLPFVALVLLAALAYLPLAGKLGFSVDDWYLVFAAHTQGVAKFFQIFAIDRPARAPLMAVLYTLMGDHVLWYSLTAYAYRVVGALGVFWLARLLWPRQRMAGLWMALLWVLYPGFLDQPNAFDYQSHILTAALTMLSVAFTAKALLAAKSSSRILWTALSLLSFLVGVALMEYYIGVEGLRLGVIVLLTMRQEPLGGSVSRNVRGFLQWLWPRTRRVFLRWLPYLLLAAAFLFWRVFLFHNQRAATDISGMFSSLAGSPVQRGLWFLMYLLQDMLNVILFAWAVPAYSIAFRMRLRDLLIGGGLALLALAIALVIALALAYLDRRLGKNTADEDEQAGLGAWKWEALWVGLFAVFAAAAPIILGDRHVVFSAYGRFTLPGAAGAVMVVVSALYMLRERRLRLALLALLVSISTLVHYANARQYADAWEVLRNFWWQVSWRAPQIKPGTTLVGFYPLGAAPEDYYVWSPANLIYYPEKSNETLTPIRLPAAVLSSETVQFILSGSHTDSINRRSLLSERDFGHTLTLTMPTTDSCVHILDGRQPELSDQEDERIQLIAPRSQLDSVITTGAGKAPPGGIFGVEPPHDWCYIYEKAGLARQRGDWPEVARLGKQAIASKQHPIDWVEWMPFVQAFAYTGQDDAVRSLAPILKDNVFLKYQTCQLFKNGESTVAAQYRQGQKYLVDTFCN